MADDGKTLIREMKARGWRARRRRGHVVMYSPGGTGIVTVSASPGEYRGLKNTKAQVARIERQEAREGQR